ncbi:MAG: hypothetical protein HPY70_01245 [Firmicutes bacterium]|nr:hypothetical protein [Bacillota bacterium]
MLDRAYGCLICAAIGDAMGMPASFMSPEQIKNTYGRITDFMEPSKEQTAHACLTRGEITDDTEESLIISSVLMETKRFDLDLFIEKMRKWALDKKMLESTVIGPSTRKFLECIIKGEDFHESGKYGDTNGGAMRVMPIGIFNHGNLEKATEDAVLSSLPSHGSKPGVASTCAVAAAVSLAVEGGSTPKQVIEAALYGAQKGEERGYDIPAPSVVARIQLAIEIVEKNKGKQPDEICYELYRYIGAGMKSYESVPFSLGIFYAVEGDVEKGIITAVNIGDDADTNASIVGGLCGAYSGTSRVNPSWIKKIERKNSIDFKKIALALLKK